MAFESYVFQMCWLWIEKWLWSHSWNRDTMSFSFCLSASALCYSGYHRGGLGHLDDEMRFYAAMCIRLKNTELNTIMNSNFFLFKRNILNITCCSTSFLHQRKPCVHYFGVAIPSINPIPECTWTYLYLYLYLIVPDCTIGMKSH